MIQWFAKDWGLKVISLLLAVGLWYYAVSEESIEVTRSVPLEIEIENPQMSILKASANAVEVTMQAPRALLSDMTSKKVVAVHKVANDVKTAGDYSFRLEPREVQVPSPQIHVTGIEPEVVAVTLDEMIVQKLEIKPDLVGEPAIGYRVNENEIQLNPNAILLEGPKGQLEKLDSVKTERIHLVGRIRSFRSTVGLMLPHNVKPLSEALVDAYIPIQEELDEKIFENVSVRVVKPPRTNGQIELDPASVTFTLRGPRRQLEKIKAEEVLAYVDISALPQGTHTVPLTLVVPEEVELAGEPLQIQVVLKK